MRQKADCHSLTKLSPIQGLLRILRPRKISILRCRRGGHSDVVFDIFASLSHSEFLFWCERKLLFYHSCPHNLLSTREFHLNFVPVQSGLNFTRICVYSACGLIFNDFKSSPVPQFWTTVCLKSFHFGWAVLHLNKCQFMCWKCIEGHNLKIQKKFKNSSNLGKICKLL